MTSYYIHNDEPTITDVFGRSALVKKVGNAVAQCTPPHVFGIHGDWGSGKTSFLYQLQMYLTGDCPQLGLRDAASIKASIKKQWGEKWTALSHVTTVWFEAWRYQHDAAPIVALLQEIRTQLPLSSKLLRKAGKLGDVTVRGALLSIEDLTKQIGIQASKIEGAGEKWERDHLATKLPSHMIREQLEHAIKPLMSKGNKDAPTPRLVILIDDLDRCEPEAAYRLLEGIKIYLNLPSCVFVLGMNQKLIERAICRHIPGEEDHKLQLAREYLEKICQDIWHLPVPENIGGRLREFLDSLGVASTIAQSVGDIVQEYKCVPANPRKLKAFSNIAKRYIDQFSGQEWRPIQGEVEKMLIMASLYHFHHDIYRRLEAWPEFYVYLHRWANGDDNAHEVLKGLKRAESISEEEADRKERAAIPGEADLTSTYPDPGASDVLLVQSLIRSIGLLTEEDVKKYLLR